MRRIFVLLLVLTSASAWASPGEGRGDHHEATQTTRELVIERVETQVQQVRAGVGARASDLVQNAMGFLGVPYRFGGNSADTGFDCSGLVRKVFELSVGKLLPRRADEQAAVTQTIDRSELKPGDLVFFNTMKRAFSHVGIYIGDGKFIHAPRSGSSVRVEDMRLAYWQTRFNGARRVSLSSDSASIAR